MNRKKEDRRLLDYWIGWPASSISLCHLRLRLLIQIYTFLTELLIVDANCRPTLASCLAHSSIVKLATPNSVCASRSQSSSLEIAHLSHSWRGRLWVLHPSDSGNPMWVQREMWLSQDGTLCCFDPDQERFVVLADASTLASSHIEVCQAADIQSHKESHRFAFRIKRTRVSDGMGSHASHPYAQNGGDSLTFSCDSCGGRSLWLSKLRHPHGNVVMVSVALGLDASEDLFAIRKAHRHWVAGHHVSLKSRPRELSN